MCLTINKSYYALFTKFWIVLLSFDYSITFTSTNFIFYRSKNTLILVFLINRHFFCLLLFFNNTLIFCLLLFFNITLLLVIYYIFLFHYKRQKNIKKIKLIVFNLIRIVKIFFYVITQISYYMFIDLLVILKFISITILIFK